VQDGPIVQMMFGFYRGDWKLRMRSLKIAPSFSDSPVESLLVQGCRERQSCIERQRAQDSVFRSYCLLGCVIRPWLTTETSKAVLVLSNE
jgi:hypothetical protein